MSPGFIMSDAITALVAEKRAVGYKYAAEARVLAGFAAFCHSGGTQRPARAACASPRNCCSPAASRQQPNWSAAASSLGRARRSGCRQRRQNWRTRSPPTLQLAVRAGKRPINDGLRMPLDLA